MAKQNFFNFTKILGEEMEALLVNLKGLISTKKITDNLPDNTKYEINDITNKINNLDIDTIDGGKY